MTTAKPNAAKCHELSPTRERKPWFLAHGWGTTRGTQGLQAIPKGRICPTAQDFLETMRHSPRHGGGNRKKNRTR